MMRFKRMDRKEANRRYRERHPDYFRDYNIKNKDRKRLANIKWLYGISVGEYEALILVQNNQCAICKTEFDGQRRITVDHDHGTNEVRGLLCQGCNTAIGLFKDRQALLEFAIDYLDSPPYSLIQSKLDK